ncbi:MAG: radical SAM protein [Nitrospinae bacterium]|nr:radical SAM protein [Nitrospinota bacterium]
MDNGFFFYIDVIGGCNLKCPSCPMGNSSGIPRPNGLMEPAFLNSIMKKAVNECKVVTVGLFNWTEPLLHPRLPELVRIVKSYGIPCSISTNLNVRKSFDDLLKSEPDAIYISTSGFYQDIYERTHKGGDIELVKSNMKTLAEAKKIYSGKTHITVMFHRYRGNQRDEFLLRDFSKSLSFSFQTDYARMAPIEKVLAYVSKNSESVELTAEDYELLKMLPIPLDDAMKLARKNKERPCSFLSNQIVLNVLGGVQLCCATYDSRLYEIGNYMDMTLKQIQELRYKHQMCVKCGDSGGHIYYTPSNIPEFEIIAAEYLAGE